MGRMSTSLLRTGATSERPHVSGGDSIGEGSSSALVSPISRGSHLGRLIGLGLLVIVTIGAISLVVVTYVPSVPVAGPWPLAKRTCPHIRSATGRSNCIQQGHF